MAKLTINYENKEQYQSSSTYASKYKCQASDLNNIKSSFNGLLDLLGLTANTWSSTGTYKKDEVVVYNNHLFSNLTGNNTTSNPETDTTNWQPETILTNN